MDIDVAEYTHLLGEFARDRLKESDLHRAEKCATASRNRRILALLHRLRGEWMATQGDWQAAVRSLNEAVRMMREVGRRDSKGEALLALAKFRLGRLRRASAQQPPASSRVSVLPGAMRYRFLGRCAPAQHVTDRQRD